MSGAGGRRKGRKGPSWILAQFSSFPSYSAVLADVL